MKYERLEIKRGVIKACDALLFRARLDQGNDTEAMILRKLLNELVWRYTEAHEFRGKYRGCAWWSVEALGLFDTPKSDWRKSVALEHVIGRKELIDALLKASSIDEVSAVLERGETCVVLRDQHKHLPKGQGWERYKNLRIVPGPLVREHQRRSGSPTSTNRTSEERVATILLPNSVARPIKEWDGLTPPPAKSH